MVVFGSAKVKFFTLTLKKKIKLAAFMKNGKLMKIRLKISGYPSPGKRSMLGSASEGLPNGVPALTSKSASKIISGAIYFFLSWSSMGLSPKENYDEYVNYSIKWGKYIRVLQI